MQEETLQAPHLAPNICHCRTAGSPGQLSLLHAAVLSSSTLPTSTLASINLTTCNTLSQQLLFGDIMILFFPPLSSHEVTNCVLFRSSTASSPPPRRHLKQACLVQLIFFPWPHIHIVRIWPYLRSPQLKTIYYYYHTNKTMCKEHCSNQLHCPLPSISLSEGHGCTPMPC